MALTELRALRLWVFIGWMLVLLVLYLSLSPTPIETGGEQGDKGLHVLAYAGLMGWFASVYDELGRRRKFAAGFVAMGITLELVQGLTGLRDLEGLDMVANATGVVVGWSLAPPRLPNALKWVERVLLRPRP